MFRIPKAPRSVPAYGGSPYARSILGAPALRALRARGLRLPFFRSLAPRALAPSLAAGARFPAPMGTGLGSAHPPLSGRICVSFGRSVPLRRPFGSGGSCAPVGAWLRPSRRAGLALVTLEVSKEKDVLRTIPHPPTLLWVMAYRGIPQNYQLLRHHSRYFPKRKTPSSHATIKSTISPISIFRVLYIHNAR